MKRIKQQGLKMSRVLGLCALFFTVVSTSMHAGQTLFEANEQERIDKCVADTFPAQARYWRAARALFMSSLQPHVINRDLERKGAAWCFDVEKFKDELKPIMTHVMQFYDKDDEHEDIYVSRIHGKSREDYMNELQSHIESLTFCSSHNNVSFVDAVKGCIIDDLKCAASHYYVALGLSDERDRLERSARFNMYDKKEVGELLELVYSARTLGAQALKMAVQKAEKNLQRYEDRISSETKVALQMQKKCYTQAAARNSYHELCTQANTLLKKLEKACASVGVVDMLSDMHHDTPDDTKKQPTSRITNGATFFDKMPWITAAALWGCIIYAGYKIYGMMHREKDDEHDHKGHDKRAAHF